MPRRLVSSLVLALALVPACKGEDQAADKPPAAQADASAGADSGKASGEGGAEGAAEGAPGPEAEGEAEGAAGETGEIGETGAEEPAAALPESFEKVGVAACDEYVAAYEACIAQKVPEAEREAQRRIVFENVKSWKQTAEGGPAAEKGLQTACKIATEQAKRATQAWACEW